MPVAAPGWYADPARTPGRFRYWDGRSWSQVTTDNPADPPPGAPPPRGRRPGPLVALVAALVVVVILAVVAVRAVLAESGRVTEEALPSSTISGGDDSSPTPTPSPTPSSPAPATPSPVDSTPPPLVDCPRGDPDARQPYPADGRIHGGGLSFPEQPGWEPSQLRTGLTWAYDVNGQDKAIEPQWYAMFAVGALSVVDGFEVPAQAAESVMQCTATSDYYQGFTGRKDLHSTSITLAGRPGWSIRSEIYVDTDRTDLPGDVVDVVVIDMGAPEALAMFWGAVPIGDQAMIDQLDQVVSQLQPG